MIKKFIAIIMISVTLTACGQKSPNVYDGRYTIEEVNSYVRKITDLKTNRIRFETKDGDVTEWYSVDTTWDNANITTWDDI